eukprot:1962353-Rhodomonas_salina.6
MAVFPRSGGRGEGAQLREARPVPCTWHAVVELAAPRVRCLTCLACAAQVINLLRTGAIDRGIEQGITAETIAEHNEKALLAEGLAEVERNFKGLSES